MDKIIVAVTAAFALLLAAFIPSSLATLAIQYVFELSWQQAMPILGLLMIVKVMQTEFVIE